jgi:hypothetical protein
VVQADKGSGFLVSKKSYTDFQIRAEFWADPAANSGIFIRCTDPQKISSKNSYEINIYDKRPDPDYGTGRHRRCRQGVGYAQSRRSMEYCGAAGVVRFRKLEIKPL